MSFIRSAWRVVMVVKDGLVLLFLLLFFGLLAAALTMVRPAPGAERGALLVRLDGVVVEQPAQEDPLAMLGQSDAMREHRLRDVVYAIERAATDDDIKAVVVDLGQFMGTGHVAAQRIGLALDRVRKAGKPVFAQALAYDDTGYAIAAHASEIWLQPLGMVAITGPGGSQLFYKGLIDKLGINAHIYRVGTYKSFVEPFIRTDQSPEAREASKALADALWTTWRDSVGKARPKAQIARYTDDPLIVARQYGGDAAKAALDLRLVDRLGDAYAFAARVADVAGEDPDGRPDGYAAIAMEDYLRRHPADHHPGKVGVVTVAGDIVDGEGGPGTAAGDSIAGIVADALADDKIAALVVRVDSPGGSVTGAETIRQALLQAKARGIPVVVSMANVAASGGYWISTAADRIFAEPATITGSIGVFGIIPSFEGSLAKIGVTTDGVKTTALSGEPDVAGGISPTFDTLAQTGVENIYRRFVGLVAKARGLSTDATDRIAQGRVWDGGTARQLRLVDSFGGLDEAIAEAARRAKLNGSDAAPRWLDPVAGPLEEFAALFGARLRADAPGQSRDWLTMQADRRRALALSAVGQAQTMLMGSAIRADCLECGAYAPPARQIVRPTGWLDRIATWLVR
jgi:protease-4